MIKYIFIISLVVMFASGIYLAYLHGKQAGIEAAYEEFSHIHIFTE